MNILEGGTVCFSRPSFQAVSNSFFTVKWNAKAGYSRLHVSEVSQSESPWHHNMLQPVWSHMEHNRKAFQQGSSSALKQEGTIVFVQSAAKEFVPGPSTEGKHQSLNYTEQCHAVRTGFCFPAARTHTRLLPTMQNEPSASSEARGSLWMSLELPSLSFFSCRCSHNEFHNEAKAWL